MHVSFYFPRGSSFVSSQVRERFVSEPAFLAMTVESERIRLFKEFISALMQVSYYFLLTSTCYSSISGSDHVFFDAVVGYISKFCVSFRNAGTIIHPDRLTRKRRKIRSTENVPDQLR